MAPTTPTGLAWGHTTDRVPYGIYTDRAIFEREIERIFEGPSWSYVALAAEVPEPGSFLTTWVGRRSVIVTRAKEGSVAVLENRCAHRGVQLCDAAFGRSNTLQCPYHQWTYALDGRLLGVPFRKGVAGKGGMPAEFNPTENGLRSLQVHERGGVIFASFADAANGLLPFADDLGPTMLEYFDRVFDGRELAVLGHMHQRIPANWKLVFENIKDPYHASVLHVFLVTFGLFRADAPSSTKMDPTGRHSVLVASRPAAPAPTDALANEVSSAKPGMTLADPRLLDPVREFPGDATVVMQTLWPNLIVQQQSNTLAMRQIVPRSAGEMDLHWTFFGYADDTSEMTERRLRQANLMGPSGLVSVDDSEVLALAQRGVEAAVDASALVAMGAGDVGDVDHIVTETAIRAFYRAYREVMGE